MSKKYIPAEVMTMLDNLALHFRLSRLRRNLTQREVADMCGLSIDTVAKLENSPGNVSLENFLIVVFYLNRLNEIKDILHPLKDEHACMMESDELLARKRVGKKKISNELPSPDFDWSILDSEGK